MTWLFLYPKEAGLVGRYLRCWGHGRVRRVVWIGPGADKGEVEGILEEYRAVMIRRAWGKRAVGDCGLSEYEEWWFGRGGLKGEVK